MVVQNVVMREEEEQDKVRLVSESLDGVEDCFLVGAPTAHASVDDLHRTIRFVQLGFQLLDECGFQRYLERLGEGVAQDEHTGYSGWLCISNFAVAQTACIDMHRNLKLAIFAGNYASAVGNVKPS
jgi:hypothetical protein